MRKNLPSRKTGAFAPVVFAHVLAMSFSILFVANESFSQATMIMDINQQEEIWSNEYGSLVAADGFFYFTSHTELWRSGGTYETSAKLKTFKGISGLTMVGTTLFFAADDGSGTELWKSNGTTASTVRVKDIYPGTSSSTPSNFTNVNGVLYFTAIGPSIGRELWKSDGTASGTVLVKDILTGSGTSKPTFLTNVNGTLCFAANDGSRGFELWKSNGTAAGTVIVKDIRTEAKVSSSPEKLVAVGGSLFFVASDGISGKELWKSDGTVAGTFRVKDIMAGTASSGIDNLTAVNSVAFFTANDNIHGHELWKSDGTAAGTVLVKDMTPGPAGSHGELVFSARMGSFKNINGTLFYTAYQGQDYYIWKSNGTAAGTVPLYPAGGPGISQPNAQFTYMNGNIYYFNDEFGGASNEYYLYRMNMDGSGAESIDYFTFVDAYNPYYPAIITVGNKLYIAARHHMNEGFRIYSSDGTWEGSGSEVIDTYSATIGSDPSGMVNFNGKVYFHTRLDEYPYYDFMYPQVWRTDGTAAGTEHLFDGTNMKSVVANDRLFVASFDEVTTVRKIDAAGVVTKLLELPEGYEVVRMIYANGNVFFYTDDGEIWRTNGLPTGTVKLKTVEDGSEIKAFEPLGSSVIFHIVHGDGEELWKSNGSIAGTVRIRTISTSPGIESRYYTSLVWNKIVYFIANDGTHGNEVWRSDGTSAGTYMLADINANDKREADDPRENDIAALHVFQNKLYISARQIVYSSPGVVASDKWELRTWSGGASTAVVAAMDPAKSMVSDAGTLYILKRPPSFLLVLSAYNPATGVIEDLKNFGHEYNIRSPDFAFANGSLYFSVWGEGLWRTNGTACSTIPVPTGSPTMAHEIELLGTSLVMGAVTSNKYGVEPYIYPLSAALPVPPCAAASVAAETSMARGMSLSGYPNPSTDYFRLRVETDAEESLEVTVFRMDGSPVEQIRALHTATDYEIGQQWNPGWYIIRAVTPSGVFTDKVLKR
jgi:ELWxxDGT repeat protein